MSDASASSDPKSIAQVVLDLPAPEPFDYAVPEGLRATVGVGRRVRVPFRNGERVGTVVGFLSASSVPRVRPILAVIEPTVAIPASLLALARWMAETTLCGWGEALAAAVPAGVRAGRARRTVEAVRLARPAAEALAAAAGWTGAAARRRQIVELLAARPESPAPTADVLRATGASRAPLAWLVREGWVARTEVEPPSIAAEPPPDRPVVLNEAQKRAVERITSSLGSFKAFLLHGVTGSGKTEVYLRAVEAALRGGRQSIVLVPEIALTPQTVGRFLARFPRLEVLHSSLTEGQRAEAWRRIAAGAADVIVGARSAVLAPAPRLGLVVVDEEHEPSYKQESVPRYHARDAAMQRATIEGVPVVFGTATPSLELFDAARRGRVETLSLPERVGGLSQPAIEIVDVTQESGRGGRLPVLSRRLQLHLADVLSRGRQAILFMNRRGYATVLLCRRCGWAQRCPVCEVAMALHRATGRMMCHHCGRDAPPPETCGGCGVPAVGRVGVGTERVEEEVARKFPSARILRMDSDRMRTHADYDAAYRAFRDGEADVLIGTQMVAKGLDFPRVTLVGVISADTSLDFPDFRSAERTFQLIAQVAGRAGRGPDGGRVVVQTVNPEHPSITCAARLDYPRFAHQELAMRQEHGFPPARRLVRIVVRGTSEEAVTKHAADLAAAARAALREDTGEILGPSPCALPRLKGRWRREILFKTENIGYVTRRLAASVRLTSPSRSLQVFVDVDPYHFL